MPVTGEERSHRLEAAAMAKRESHALAHSSEWLEAAVPAAWEAMSLHRAVEAATRGETPVAPSCWSQARAMAAMRSPSAVPEATAPLAATAPTSSTLVAYPDSADPPALVEHS